MDVRNSEIGLRRQKALAPQGLAPQADLDQAQANYDSAVPSVAQAQATLEQAQTDLREQQDRRADRRRRRGPPVRRGPERRGVLHGADDLHDRPGPDEDAGRRPTSRSPTSACARSASRSDFTVDAYPDQMFRGTISQIRLNATVNQNVVTYPVIIDVPNPDLALRPNMTANVTIDVAVVKDVLRIPNAALRFRPEEKEGAASAAARRTPSPAAPAASPEERAAAIGRRPRPGGGHEAVRPLGGRRKGPQAGADRLHAPAADGEPKAGGHPHRHHRRPVHAGRLRRAEGRRHGHRRPRDDQGRRRRTGAGRAGRRSPGNRRF